MNLVQNAIAPTGISCDAGAWRAKEGEMEPPTTYIVYTTTRHEARHADDDTTEWSVHVYMELYSLSDPTDARKAVRAAMYAAGFHLVEERETYERETATNRVSWTWRIFLDPEEEGRT